MLVIFYLVLLRALHTVEARLCSTNVKIGDVFHFCVILKQSTDVNSDVNQTIRWLQQDLASVFSFQLSYVFPLYKTVSWQRPTGNEVNTPLDCKGSRVSIIRLNGRMQRPQAGWMLCRLLWRTECSVPRRIYKSNKPVECNMVHYIHWTILQVDITWPCQDL